MGAKRKLNQAYFNGSLIAAFVIGLLTQSWLVFGVVLVGMLAMNVAEKNIR